ITSMGEFYTYLNDKKTAVIDAVKQEEEKFLKTIYKGYEYLEQLLKDEKTVSGKNALLLFESYGFPIELTVEMTQENNKDVDIEEFEKLLENVKEISRKARKDDKA